jgi:hypothetical protein
LESEEVAFVFGQPGDEADHAFDSRRGLVRPGALRRGIHVRELASVTKAGETH